MHEFLLVESEATYHNICSWLEKQNVKYIFNMKAEKASELLLPSKKAKKESNVFPVMISIEDDKKAKIFKETWVFDIYFRFDPSCHTFTKLNEYKYTSRGIKFLTRHEIVNWCHNHGIKFKFQYDMNGMRVAQYVTGIYFLKEEDKALFLLQWQ